jgi:hypothetical protein
MKYYIGIDNGASGSIGIVDENGRLILFIKVPTKEEPSYLKSKLRMIRRVDFFTWEEIMEKVMDEHEGEYKAFIERPLVNPSMFHATMSGIRALEATLIALEDLRIPYEYIDSKQWQKVLLPSGSIGHDQLKLVSREVGKRLFPQTEGVHEDADGILIAEWARRSNR